MTDPLDVTTAPDGTLLVGPPPVGAAGVGLLAFPGFTALVDPMTDAPHLVVHDPEAASELITDAGVRRLLLHAGRLSWLRDTRPLPLDPDLLDLECRAARADLPWNDPDDPDEAAVTSQEQQVLTGIAELSALRPAADAWSVGDLTVPVAAHLGARPGTGTASLDWGRVPPTLVPSPDDSATYELIPASGGAGELRVEVAPPPPVILHPAVVHVPPNVAPLVAVLTAFGWPLPLASGTLRADDRGRLTASIPVTPEAMMLARQAASLGVDLRAAHLPWTPPDPAREARAAARRWAARGWASLCLAAALGDRAWEAMARDALRYAARRWAGLDAAASARCTEAAEAPAPTVALSLAEIWFGGRAGKASS